MSLRQRSYLVEGKYYDIDSKTSIRVVMKRWQNWDKVYDRSMPVLYSLKDVWPHREYNWTRETSRPGYASVKGKRVHLDGPMKWDAIKADMEENGWDKKQPLYIHVGRMNGGIKVGEGNHRLAIAKELGIQKVPVWFIFHDKVTKSRRGGQSTFALPPKAVKKVVKKAAKEKEEFGKLSPQARKHLDNIMKELGLK